MGKKRRDITDVEELVQQVKDLQTENAILKDRVIELERTIAQYKIEVRRAKGARV